MALCPKVIDLIGLYFLNNARQIADIAQISIVRLEAGVVYMGILVYVVDAISVK
jgi:hypothetical protein